MQPLDGSEGYFVDGSVRWWEGRAVAYALSAEAKRFIKLLYRFLSIMSSSILFPTNEYATSSKSSEEIQKLTMPLFSAPEDALAHLIAKGLPSQMPYLYRHLHLAPKLTLAFACVRAPAEHPDNQIIIAEALLTLLNATPADLTAEDVERIFETCLECLNNLHSPANEAVGSVLEATMKAHPDNRRLVRRLEEAALELGRPAQPIISKVSAGRLIAVLAKYQGRTVKGEMVDILKRVVGDSEAEARKVWVSEIFPRLLQNLELEFIELHLQEKIYESVWDENEEIGVLALEAILRHATRFSLEEQSSRIVKLFIDSLTSKKEKVALLASQLLGEAYEKLLHIILRSEHNCVRFWKSLVELSQSRCERVLNNLAYNLPGVLALSAPLYRVDPLCDVYVELFYQPLANKLLLASYFHEVVRLFPGKAAELREVVYWMFGELFEEEEPCEDAVRIVVKLLAHLPASRAAFLEPPADDRPDAPRYFDGVFSDYLVRVLGVALARRNCNWLGVVVGAIRGSCEWFAGEFVEGVLLPRLYGCLRAKTAWLEAVVETVAVLVSRDGSPQLINAYASKINVELSKSTRSYERETALLFFYYASHYLSVDLFQEYRLGEKYLYFNNDKAFRVKATFIKHLPRLAYFFTREEKIENAIILSRLAKDPDLEVQLLIENTNFAEDEPTRQAIAEASRRLREKEKERMGQQATKKQLVQVRRSSKELKKEDVLKKRIETTKSKTKMLIKDVPKKKVAPVLVKTTSNLNFRKNS